MSSDEKFDVYTVIEDNGGAKPFWLKIGRMFPHKNGDGGFNIILNASPFTRKLVIKKRDDNDEFENED